MNLINGDCLEEMKKIEDNKIDLLFCDLPYGCTSCKWDIELDLKLFWKEVNRICKLNCPMFFCCNVKFGNTLINSNPKNFRYDLVWIKSSSAGFLNSKKMPMKKHELIYVFYRKLPFYNLSSHKYKFIKERTGSINGVYGKDKKKLFNEGQYDPSLPVSIIKECKSTNIYGDISTYEYTERKNSESIYDPPLPNSILEIKSEKGKHSTQKPVKLIEWILKYYSKEDDTVLDPTMGSGSSGVACKNMKREFIGIEKDKEIFKVAKQRINS